jgi:DNA-binding NarL/FixJ family response regulator
MKVLIADDSGLILDRLQEMLSMYKQAELIGSYKDGTKALAALRSLKPDLAIVDIKMTGLSGLEVLSEIRKENKIVKIIILTFYSSDHHRQMAIQAGADYFFTKVDDFDKLSMVVAGMVLKEVNGNKNSVIIS